MKVTEYICACGKCFKSNISFKHHYPNCILWWKANKSEEEYLAWRQRAKLSLINYKLKVKEQELENWISEKHVCEKCGKIMTEKYGSGRFCSRACANSRTHSEETKQKIRDSVLADIKLHPEHVGDHGGKVVNFKFSSKAERELRAELQARLPEYNFKVGGFASYNGYRLNPDIYSHEYKLVIEYDGIWHFKSIYAGQLESKQFKDNLLLDFIYNSDYRLIRIDEEYKFSYDEIVALIKTNSDKVILLGNRYDYLKLKNINQ